MAALAAKGRLEPYDLTPLSEPSEFNPSTGRPEVHRARSSSRWVPLEVTRARAATDLPELFGVIVLMDVHGTRFVVLGLDRRDRVQ
jgi:hypothetical protein